MKSSASDLLDCHPIWKLDSSRVCIKGQM